MKTESKQCGERVFLGQVGHGKVSDLGMSGKGSRREGKGDRRHGRTEQKNKDVQQDDRGPLLSSVGLELQ
jgi:hypothetical protein